MASSVVFKVKYGDTLRRFNPAVNGDKLLDLNINELRAKIRSLFNLPSDADFTMTYEDEDDDQVTLGDDEDLHDVMRQSLNPVRITVKLIAEKSAPSGAKSSGSVTDSPALQILANINPGVAESLKYVPEPVRDALSKLSLDLATKAGSNAPVFADLMEYLSKVRQPHLNTSPSPHPDASVSEKPQPSVDEGKKRNEDTFQPLVVDVKGAESIAPPLPPSLISHKGKDAKRKDKGIIGDYAKSGINFPEPLNDRLEKHPSYPKETSGSTNGKNRRCKFGGNSSTSTFDAPLPGECPFSGVPLEPPPRQYKGFDIPPFQPFNGSYNNTDGMGSIFHKGVRCDGCGVLPITGPRFKSKVKHNYDLCSICFARVGNDADYLRIDCPSPYRHPRSLKGFHGPVVNLHHMPLPAMVRPLPSVVRPCVTKHLRSRLDSRFIMDVNVMDGIMMAPSTPFTKIWRMRNNGTLPWSRGLQLLWIGGDRFSASDSVVIEMPIEGVKVGNELDIAVDFIAPELPGRYISYWRMAEPSGHKFGQRVWVLIQVDASLKDSTCESSASLNLNVPPEVGANFNVPPEASRNVETPVLDVNVEPSLAVEVGNLNPAPEAENSSLGKRIRKVEIEDLNFPINDDLLIAGDISCAASVTATASSSASPAGTTDNPMFPAPSSISYPEVDVYYKPESASAPPSPMYPVIDMPKESSASSSNAGDDKKSPEQDTAQIEVEESMLKELEQMGFKQVDLNKEVLRMNEYDLERSVDELCGVSEWDPILGELQEMGFHDKETNKKLLEKNNGSIMRVVMDLVSGEKA